MTVLTGVGAHFCAAHRGRDGVLHGHTYEVTAWFTAGRDAVELQAELRQYLAQNYDQSQLKEGSSLGEEIAAQVMEALGAAEVIVSRSPERIYARATK